MKTLLMHAALTECMDMIPVNSSGREDAILFTVVVVRLIQCQVLLEDILAGTEIPEGAITRPKPDVGGGDGGE